jgi:hypothetical protein
MSQKSSLPQVTRSVSRVLMPDMVCRSQAIGTAMLTHKSIETLIDLVEIKLSCIEVWDRDDRRERDALASVLKDLKGMEKSIAGSSRVNARLRQVPTELAS